MSTPHPQHEAEIVRLLHLYCQYIDQKNFEGFGQLFSAEGRLDLNGSPAQGPAQITQFIRDRSKTPSLHFPSGHVIEFTGPAQARVYSTVVVYKEGAADSLPVRVAAPAAVATYHDELTRENERWAFRSRKASVFMAG